MPRGRQSRGRLVSAAWLVSLTIDLILLSTCAGLKKQKTVFFVTKSEALVAEADATITLESQMN